MTQRHPYAPRIDRVMTYIHLHLTEDLTLDRLADVAALSRFHFSRSFRDITGEGPVAVVRRIRLNRAAILMVASDLPIGRVADASHYANVQSFERAFRRAFGCTPVAARGGCRMLSPIIPSRTGDWTMYPVELRTEDPFKIAALSHTGPYVDIGPVFEKMDEMVQMSGVPFGPLVGIYYDNPQDTPLDQLRAHAGREMLGDEVPEGMETVEIDGGPVAVLTHVGHFSGLPAAWHYMFTVALPERGLEIRPGQMFERYTNKGPDTPIENVVTEICVPVTRS